MDSQERDPVDVSAKGQGATPAASRREFACGLAASAATLAVTATMLVPAGSAEAATRLAASATRKCGTCDYWGGRRKISADGAYVEASGTGTCGNPKSPVYNKKTRPDQGAPVWKRWSKLG